MIMRISLFISLFRTALVFSFLNLISSFRFVCSMKIRLLILQLFAFSKAVNLKSYFLFFYMCVFKMQKRWSNKNVDLELLTGCIGDFFKEKEFDAVKGESSNGYQILAENSPRFELNGYLSVTVKGDPNDFVVALDFYGEKKRKGLMVGPLTMALFGGGIFLSRRLKSEENWIKFEREFWDYVDNALMRLADSAKY